MSAVTKKTKAGGFEAGDRVVAISGPDSPKMKALIDNKTVLTIAKIDGFEPSFGTADGEALYGCWWWNHYQLRCASQSEIDAADAPEPEPEPEPVKRKKPRVGSLVRHNETGLIGIACHRDGSAAPWRVQWLGVNDWGYFLENAADELTVISNHDAKIFERLGRERQA